MAETHDIGHGSPLRTEAYGDLDRRALPDPLSGERLLREHHTRSRLVMESRDLAILQSRPLQPLPRFLAGPSHDIWSAHQVASRVRRREDHHRRHDVPDE